MGFLGSNLSWFILTVIVLSDFLITNLIGLFYPGYSSTRQFISTLGSKKSPVAPVFNVWLTIVGIFMCIYAINFQVAFYSTSKLLSTIGALLLTSFGIGTGILGGLFQFSEERKFGTTSSIIHSAGAGFGFACLLFIPLIVGMISFKTYSNTIGIFSIALFLLSLVLALLFMLSQKELFKKSNFDLIGLWQRLLIACVYTPLFLLGINYLISVNYTL